jgi:hypothetical protein
MATPPVKGDRPVEDITILASVQFATHFELIDRMLRGEWDEKTYQRFSLYDGVVHEVIKKYANTYQNDAVWGPFLKERVELQLRILEHLKPLIVKRQAGKRLSDKELAWLTATNREIREKLLQ